MGEADKLGGETLVGAVMSVPVLEVGGTATLREAARQMARRRLGAAVVPQGDGDGLSIITERDLLVSLGAGEDPDRETVGDHATRDVVFAAPGWSLEEAAVTMIRGDFRHLVVLDGADAVGVLSLRDVVR
ncbi:MAG TPA: CBS domain-containing protein, partial [Solirubrobacteraceae bacterium]|nr:CBS domain-containing protein [Solirubrobacteraceae bacterium]